MSTHTHPCSSCQTPVECDGERERNEDGWPAVICRAFHLLNGDTNPRCLCEPCEDAEARQGADDPDGPWGAGFAENH